MLKFFHAFLELIFLVVNWVNILALLLELAVNVLHLAVDALDLG